MRGKNPVDPVILSEVWPVVEPVFPSDGLLALTADAEDIQFVRGDGEVVSCGRVFLKFFD